MASSASDRTVNKIALCGAIFAGVAYVGYSVVKQAFGKTFYKGDKKKEDENGLLEYEPHRRGRIYLRRLSGSGVSAAAAEVFLRNQQESSENGFDVQGSGRLILRPLSVQQRIRELNLRARHFAETVLAVQLQDGYDRPPTMNQYGHAISLQPSPMHTPRPLSPIDITHLGSSRCSSIENLSLTGTSPHPSSSISSNGYGSLRRPRWSRRSSRRLLKSPDLMSKEDLDEVVGNEAEKLLDERENELRRRLQGFENGTAKVLTPYEAKSLVALLHSKDCETLERVLVTVSNSAAFTANQDHLREAGCLARLQHLIVHSDLSVKLAAIRTTGNMALNTSNQKEMEHFVPLLLLNLDPSKDHYNDGLLILHTLSTLTNIAALTDWHQQFANGLPRILELTQSKNSKVCIQSLRLLINLSTNEEMIQHLLTSKALDYVCDLVELSQPEDQLLRVVTLFANVVCSASKLDLFVDSTFGDDDSNGHNNGHADISKVRSSKILARLSDLMNRHPHEDVRLKARMIHTVLSENNNDRENKN